MGRAVAQARVRARVRVSSEWEQGWVDPGSEAVACGLADTVRDQASSRGLGSSFIPSSCAVSCSLVLYSTAEFFAFERAGV